MKRKKFFNTAKDKAMIHLHRFKNHYTIFFNFKFQFLTLIKNKCQYIMLHYVNCFIYN